MAVATKGLGVETLERGTAVLVPDRIEPVAVVLGMLDRDGLELIRVEVVGPGGVLEDG